MQENPVSEEEMCTLW